MNGIKYRWFYKGTVKDINGNIIADDYYIETIAETEQKAQSNMKYQYKKKHNMANNTKITLCSKLMKGEAIT